MEDTSAEKGKQYLNSVVARLKNGIRKEIQRDRYDAALSLLSACAAIQYKANQCYTDTELEACLREITEKVLPPVQQKTCWDRNTILFYDGFGLNSRGLIRIYLKALCRLGHVIYLTKESCKNALPDVRNILHEGGAEIIWLAEDHPTTAMQKLYNIFLQKKPGVAFLYTRPEDVISTAVFSHIEGLTARFMINLTDHAYWLGTQAMDTCIEFRDYGAVVSVEGRGIRQEKLAKLPFYPVVEQERPFEGYPFPFDPDSQKLIFSGGALYKTLGAENRYYELVEHILDTYPETVFWYAGSGNRCQMDRLLQKYPGRAFLTPERRDFYQIIQRSLFYLSTYPITGGLMFQYAAKAGKLPITLRFDSEADGYLLDQQKLGIEAADMEQIKQLLHRVITDDAFRAEKEAQIKAAVIDEEIFLQQLQKILETGKSDYPIEMYPVDVTDLRKEYLRAFHKKAVASLLAELDFSGIAACLPVEFGLSMAKKFRDKLLHR